MRLSDFVVREAILPEAQATTKDGVIREMVASLCDAGHVPSSEVEEIVALVWKRERAGSTGIGRSVAIPHTKLKSVTRLLAAVAVARQRIDFESVDGQPVDVLVLLLSPLERPGDHLRALTAISQALADDDYVRALRQAKARDTIWELLDTAKRLAAT
jgi:PTS system fructose-specific IIA component/PTS system nitrogen regulatory IIA component